MKYRCSNNKLSLMLNVRGQSDFTNQFPSDEVVFAANTRALSGNLDESIPEIGAKGFLYVFASGRHLPLRAPVRACAVTAQWVRRCC